MEVLTFFIGAAFALICILFGFAMGTYTTRKKEEEPDVSTGVDIYRNSFIAPPDLDIEALRAAATSKDLR